MGHTASANEYQVKIGGSNGVSCILKYAHEPVPLNVATKRQVEVRKVGNVRNVRLFV